MKNRDIFQRLFAALLAMGLIPPAPAHAQGVHLEALRMWMDHTEKAAKLVDRGDYAGAEGRLNLAIKEIKPYLPDTRRIMARSYSELAKVLYLQKRYAEAEPLARWALSVRDSDAKARPDAVFFSVYTLALIQSAQSKWGEAEQLLKRSLALQEENLGRDHVNSNLTLNQLAFVQVAQGKYADAEPLYRRSIAIHERSAPDENLDLADTAEKFAGLLRLMKRNDEADRWQARAVAIRDRVAANEVRARANRAAQQFKGFK